MDKEIPIQFDYKGEHYNAVLSHVLGAGSEYVWHLMINHFYCGQLHFYEDRQEWRFSSQTGKFEELSAFFGEYIILWTR